MKLKKKIILGLVLVTPLAAVTVMAAKCGPNSKVKRAQDNLKKAQERLEKVKADELKKKEVKDGKPTTNPNDTVTTTK